MTENSPLEQPSSNVLASFLAVVFLLATTNVVLQLLYSDFWVQPLHLTTRLGVAGYEALVLFILLTVLAIPVWLCNRMGLQRTSKLVFLVLLVPVITLLIVAWSFYGHFGRFIGSFAVQMILQDGDQLLKFINKMPSSIDPRIVFIGASTTLLALLIVIVHGSPMRQLRTVFSIAGMATVMFSVISSVLWNMPLKISNLNDVVQINTLQRVKDSKFQLLVNRAGPFTEIASSLSNTFFNQSENLNIDTARLEKMDTSPSSDAAGMINKYNVVFILVESLHPKVLQAFGSEENVMPAVNRLSENSYVLNNAWAQASHSNYADISAISGQYPLRSMNIHFYPKDPAYPRSLPYDVLEPHGYKTGLFSSQNERWGLMENYLNTGSVNAFTHVGSNASENRSVYRGVKVDSLENGDTKINYSEFMYQGSGDGIERLDGNTTDDALAWMSSLDIDAPLFLYFNYQASHVPFNALPENFERQFLTEDGDYMEKVNKGDLVGQPAEIVISAYKDSLYYVDQNVERVVSYMKETGRHENTIYVISADTAIRFTGSLMGNGAELYPEVLKVPVIISAPGLKGQAIIDAPAEQIDIMPTVLGLIGAGPHPASQGIDLLNTEPDPDRILYAVAQTPVAHQYSAIHRDWQIRHDFISKEQTLHYVGEEVDSDKISSLSEERVQWLAEQLREWRLAQIGYYTIPQAHTLYYPPKFNSDLWLSGSKTVVSETNTD